MQLTLNLLTTTIVAPPSNASKWRMGFNSAFKGFSRRYKKSRNENSTIPELVAVKGSDAGHGKLVR